MDTQACVPIELSARDDGGARELSTIQGIRTRFSSEKSVVSGQWSVVSRQLAVASG